MGKGRTAGCGSRGLGARRHPPTSLRIRGCSSADDSWRPSLCKSGDSRCFVLRLPGVMTRRPCGAQLHDDEALFSLGARGTLARCGLWRRLGGSRREPPGGPRGPPSVCSIPPPGLRLRAVYAAQVCFWMVCICGLCILGATVVPMGMGCWLGAALRRLPLLRLSEISSNDFDWMLRMETDISGWDTSRVTDMSGMFHVRAAPSGLRSPITCSHTCPHPCTRCVHAAMANRL